MKRGDLRTLSGMFGNVANRSRAFLDSCSETRLLAVSNIEEASREYEKLARDTLQNVSSHLSSNKLCSQLLSDAYNALQNGGINQDYVTALRMLRDTFLRDILRPAVADFLRNGSASDRDLEELYSQQIKMDSLLGTAHFLRKTRNM